MIRRTVAATGVLLVLFHAWLLASQALSGELAEPGLLFRWLVAGGLTAGLGGLLRSGGPLFLSRKAVALWLLAALLHGPAVVDLTGSLDAPALPEAATVVVQIATASIALGLGMLLVAAALRGSRRSHQFGAVLPIVGSPATSVNAGFALAFAARPPPLA